MPPSAPPSAPDTPSFPETPPVAISAATLRLRGLLPRRLSPSVERPPVQPRVRTPRKGPKEQLEEARAEIKELKKKNKELQRERDGAVGQRLHEFQAAEELRNKKSNYVRQAVRRAKADGVAEGMASSKATQAAEKRLTVQGRKVAQLARELLAAQDALKEVHLEHAIKHGELNEKMQEQFDTISALHSATREQEEEHQQIEAELRQELADAKPDGRALDHAAALEKMKEEVGIRAKYTSVPPRSPSTLDEEKASCRHMVAVLEGRGEGKDINFVAKALQRCGYMEELAEAPAFQPAVRAIVQRAVAKLQEHYTARHAVHIWDRLELSRSQMETLRHLISFIYDPIADTYVPIRVWQNPHAEKDYVLAAKLAARVPREKEYDSIVSTMDIIVGANGRCERDVVKCAKLLYTNYAAALRSEYSLDRPAQPVLFLDGTGGSLNRGICHAELGCADFAALDTKQSRATLQPLALYQGTDHLQDQRDNLGLVFESYNRLCDMGEISLPDHTIPCRPLTAADMQGAKATYGMHETSHAVWCMCQAREGGPHHAYPDTPMENYEEMIEYIEVTVGCKINEYDEQCGWAHFSPGVAKGGAFTKFKCSCCGYNPTETQWRADLKKYNLSSDEEQAVANSNHLDSQDELNSTHKHFHQLLFQPPLPHHGMERCGADNLHLTFLNLFKHLFKYTVHDGLPESKKKLMRAYTKQAGFYSYDAASDSEDPCKHWIGREVKRFIATAHLHLPFMLQLAAAPIDTVPELAATRNLALEEEMELDEEYAPTEEEIEEEESLEPLMMQNAQAWDNFLIMVSDFARPWPQGSPDTDEYRKGRALTYFNNMALVCNDLLRLKPTLRSWVPHIALFIVPRQMLTLGDPTRRACDACESWGAMAKKTIKHATCRHRIDKGPTEHKKGDKLWKQQFNKGFVQQAFSRLTVRESLQHGPENEAFAQRVDARRVVVGKASISRKAYQGEQLSLSTIRELCEEME